MGRSRTRMSRGGWALSALAAGSVVALAPGAAGTTRDLTGPSFPDALLAAGSLVQLGLSVWVLVVVALTATARCSALLRFVAPAAMRRMLFVGAVGAVGAMTLSPANAEQVGGPHDHSVHSVDGLRLPDRPSAALPAEPATAPSTTSGRQVVVTPGDTLWDIASRSLPRGASDTVVARATVRWYEANRDVIGPDPDLIHPGQRLTPPLGKEHP